MKTPRDLKGESLVKLLGKHFGYEQTRQEGSHIRLTTAQNGIHHLTVPRHNPVRLGTLNKILSDVASHFGITREQVINQLFN
ncbi:type II toxin-antitoxin system HicA family toxin [Spirosoma sp. SC4-14]|uniref:type II toxin-antitoxin system HicA family toxin n=1 Tax=Spirosoma sp. SC4-14 TaxID=3128900 RepID=UPI0030CDED36